MLNNPFIVAGRIPSEYFCDRIEESEKLIREIINQNNLVMVSPRRMGKSGLIKHCFENEEIRKRFKTIYIDIYQTSSLKEFVYLFGKEVYEHLVPHTTTWIAKFFQTLKSLNGKFSFDPFTGLPTFSIMLGDITTPEITLDEIFSYIEKFNRRCVIAFDEFQQITKYPEKNIEAILRTHISQCGNSNYIFAGSERHIMQEMFLSYHRPFYQSSTIMNIEAIPKNIYCGFAQDMFMKFRKELNEDAVSRLYDLFEGTTYYLQRTLNTSFSSTERDKNCSIKDIEKTIKEILEENSTYYRGLLSNLPERQKELLYAIANEGYVNGITSSAFIKKYNLLSSSSVQTASKQLLDKDFITRRENQYSLSDKFMSLWIRQIYGTSPFSIFH